MKTYFSELSGLKIIIKPGQVLRENGIVSKTQGKCAHFVNGTFRTEDPEIIKFMDNYVKVHPDTVSITDEKDLDTLGTIKAIAKSKSINISDKGIADALNRQSRKRKVPGRQSNNMSKEPEFTA